MLNFNLWIAPIIIKPIFYIGSIVCIIYGFGMIGPNRGAQLIGILNDGHGQITKSYAQPNWLEILLGIGWIFLGPLLLRVVCEVIAAIFQLREALGSKQ